ncbi:glycosyltransferase [Neokomagataea thailandica NBRC 106555]|uniref:Glycosyltransferase n=2 Tax=Neokomagataea TaxID=1223423 RepID=A0A4Y6V6X6_9PROT|nr:MULTISPECIES: glycosyltransferase [Neokomagataea]QDH24237.1 glycosyltransferase [Neokomagataea tanensis]GBR52889.1 glycosyltransferase [Neokomagataea thailandica NBRC 106555]
MSGENSIREARQPSWRLFEADWYLLRYPEAREWMAREGIDDVEVFYKQYGQRYGHSPNRYFDEVWYLEFYPDVRRAVIEGSYESGFAHYCAGGYVHNSGHWLFDELEYRRRYHELTQRALEEQGFSNGYDHFLEVGAERNYVGHRFFNSDLCRELALRFPEYFDVRLSLFASWLVLPAEVADAGRVSWYFDPVWYLNHYPAVQKEIDDGRYGNALHHYMTNDRARQFDPLEFFSEEEYAQLYPDLKAALEQGVFRNGYDHFVRFGANEGRSPGKNLGMDSYMSRPQVRRDLRNKLFDTPFTHYVAGRVTPDSQAALAGVAEIDEVQAKIVFEREAEAQLPMLVRRRLDFTYSGLPEISVIMVLYNKIALTMQALASLRANYAGAIQVIIVDSGSHDQSRQLLQFVRGVKLLRFRYNIGYLEGCNAGLEEVEAPFVLYLNNDIRLAPDALKLSLKRIRSEANIGAVGAKIIRTNMHLQEAGSVVWRDGSTYGYKRDADPNLPEANFIRDVDYCSAAFIVVRSSLLRRLSGYDPRFRPAYFEDADLCVRIIKAGFRIVYDPTIVIEHLEFGSSGASGSLTLMQANLKAFARAHTDFLRNQHPPHLRNAVHARERRGEEKRILFVEDRLPLRRLGSGYVRSNDVVREMAALGYHVTVFPMLPREQSVLDVFGDFPETVELLPDLHVADFAQFIQERTGYYDLLWVGRTHNMVRLLPVLNEMSRYLPSGGAVLDTEVIATPRTLGRLEVLDLEPAEQSFDEMLQEELDVAHFCQRIVTVTESDAGLVRRAGYENVSVLGHEMKPKPTPASFEERKDILFLGALHDPGSPNHDSLEWFVEEVLPHLDDVLPSDVKFTIAGFISQSVDMSPFALHPRVDIVGAVHDLEPLFNRHRIFVAPTRFAGGLPFKVQEAASLGIPMVVTSLLASQVGWDNGKQVLHAGINDAKSFADAIVRLYQDRELWGQLRNEALTAIREDCSPAKFRRDLDQIIQACIV